AAYGAMRGLFSSDSRTTLSASANGAARSRVEYDFPDETLELMASVPENGDVFNRISRYEMSLYMANMLLRDTDAMSMASALEVRVPFLDHVVVEQVYSLPGEMKTGATQKQLLADAMGADLPGEISSRKKTGFALRFDRWLRSSLRGFVTEALGDDKAVARAGLASSGVREALAQFDNRSKSTSWSRIWGLAVLVDWCRRHDVSIGE